MRHPTRFAGLVLLSVALATALGACSGEGTKPCTKPGDCREGFQCGVGPFEGECIQIVSVITCGANYCDRATERCQNNECVPGVPTAPPSADSGVLPREDGGPVEPPPPPSDGGLPSAPPDAESPAVNEAGFADAFVPPPEDPPIVTIATPFDGELIVDRPAELSGQVFGLTPAGRASFRLDDDPTERPLALDGSGYHAALDLPPGRHTLTVTATNGGEPGQASAGFRLDFRVTIEHDRLLMNGQPWRFVGLATPDLRELAMQAAIGGADRLPEVLGEAKRLGAKVLRVPACDDRPQAATAIQTAPGVYNEAALVALDTVIARAGEAGLKLLLPVVDASDRLGGINQYLRWNGYLVPVLTDKRHFFEAGPVREHLKTYIRGLLSRTNTVNHLRYADDPAILGWEVFTSADALGVYDVASAGTEIADFLADVTQVMQAGAPRALIGTGEVGFDVNPSFYGVHYDQFRNVGLGGLFDASHGLAWQRNLRTGTVTFAGLQLVPDLLGVSGDAILYANLGAAWIRGHAALAATTGKPLVITLAAENVAILATEARRNALSAWFDEFEALAFSGFIVGNLHADGFDRRADPYGFAWAEGTPVEDAQNELAPAVSSAAAALGTAAP